jgi:glycine oxidase
MIEAVVVGGGLAGCVVALELRDRGHAVNLVEVERTGAAATGASAGMLAPQYEAGGGGALFEMLLEGRAAFPRFAARLGELAGETVEIHWTGMLVADRDEAEHRASAERLRWQRARGLRAEHLEVGEALRIQPGIAASARSYLWLPDEGYVDTQALPPILGAALTGAGVRLLEGREVAGIERAGHAVAGVSLVDGRTLAADVVVVAAGAWSGRLQGLPRTLPVRPVRGHLLRYAPGAVALRTIVAGEGKRYLVPRGDGSLLAGSTMDEVGFDRSIDEAALADVAERAASLVPELRLHRPAEWWADLRPIALDGLPYLGADPELDGLYYATGFGRNGILLSPRAGAVLAAMISGDPVPPAWRGLGPGRG